MQTDFTIHRYPIIWTEQNKPFYVVPFGDVHRSSSNCDTEKWHEFLDWCKGRKDTYFLGMGDYLDMFSTSERKAITAADLHDSTRVTMDDVHDRWVNELYSELYVMKGRIIGLIEGNHYGVYAQTGMTTTQRLCQKLGCQYLGTSSFIRLAFIKINKTGNKDHSNCIDIWAYHGKGAAQTIGGSIKAVEDMARIAEADIFLMAHDHKKSTGVGNRLVLTGNRTLTLTKKKILFGRTGGFLRGYTPNGNSYIARKCLTPTDLGTIKLTLIPKVLFRKGQTGKYNKHYFVDIHCSI